MPQIFWTADPHLEHQAILNHANRPFPDLTAHDEALVQNWNTTVPARGALVYIVGDLAWKNHASWIQRLHGKKVLVVGNHDKMNQAALRLFAMVDKIMVVRGLAPVPIVAVHYPLLSWPNSHYGSWHVHGHSHGRCAEVAAALRVDVGVDVWNYTPVPHELLIRKFEERTREKEQFYASFDLTKNAEETHLRQAELAERNNKLLQETTR